MTAKMAAKFLLLLFSIQGVAASSIVFTDIATDSYDNSISGLAAVNVDGTVGYICEDTGSRGDSVSRINALLICNQYGYAYGNGQLAPFPRDGTVSVKNPKCSSTETDIMNCGGTSGTFYTHDCPNGAYKIKCYYPYFDMYTNMRLSEGSSTEGVVQVRKAPTTNWLNMCRDSTWDKNNREVACRQLGYNSSKMLNYGAASGNIFVKAPKCKGNENNLTQCEDSEDMYDTVVSYMCDTTGVACSGPIPEYSINGDHQTMYVNGYWEELCATSIGPDNEGDPLESTDNELRLVADLVCKGRSKTHFLKEYHKDHSPDKPSSTQLRSMSCPPKAKKLSECSMVKAPVGKGFTCYYKLNVDCGDEDDDSLNWGHIAGWIGNAMKFGLPVLFIFFGGLISLCIRANQRKRMRGQVPAGGQVAGVSTITAGAGAAAGGGYKPGFPLGHVAGPPGHPTQPPPGYSTQPPPGYPTQPQPEPTAPGTQYVAPPSYEQTVYTDWSRPTVTTNGANVPEAAGYSNPNPPKQYSWE